MSGAGDNVFGLPASTTFTVDQALEYAKSLAQPGQALHADAPGPLGLLRAPAWRIDVEGAMTESCGTCTHYKPSAGRDAMPGFGNCQQPELPRWSYVSEWPWGCRFTPSRYEGPDKNPPNPYQQMIEGGHTIGVVKDGKLIAVDAEVYVDPKDDRPPLELT